MVENLVSLLRDENLLSIPRFKLNALWILQIQSRQRGIIYVGVQNMDIVTILILEERIWKVALLHIVSRADSVFFFCSCIVDLFLFSLSSYFPKMAE